MVQRGERDWRKRQKRRGDKKGRRRREVTDNGKNIRKKRGRRAEMVVR